MFDWRFLMRGEAECTRFCPSPPVSTKNQSEMSANFSSWVPVVHWNEAALFSIKFKIKVSSEDFLCGDAAVFTPKIKHKWIKHIIVTGYTKRINLPRERILIHGIIKLESERIIAKTPSSACNLTRVTLKAEWFNIHVVSNIAIKSRNTCTNHCVGSAGFHCNLHLLLISCGSVLNTSTWIANRILKLTEIGFKRKLHTQSSSSRILSRSPP